MFLSRFKIFLKLDGTNIVGNTFEFDICRASKQILLLKCFTVFVHDLVNSFSMLCSCGWNAFSRFQADGSKSSSNIATDANDGGFSIFAIFT